MKPQRPDSLIKSIQYVAGFLAFQTITWVVFTAISMSEVKQNWSNNDFLSWAASPDFFFRGNYINATLLTLVAIVLFSLIFEFTRRSNPLLALIGIVFVTIYGIINIVCYSMQIVIVPALASDTLKAGSDVSYFVSQLIQANRNSIVGYLNGLAYALLGIPSVLFGLELIKDNRRLSGVFLLLSGAASITGIIGYSIKSAPLSSLIVVGGVLFLFAVIFMIFEFRIHTGYSGRI